MDLMSMFRKAAPEREPSQAPNRPRAVIHKHARPVLIYDSVCKANLAINHPVLQRALRMIARSVQVVNWFVEQDEDYDGPNPPTEAMLKELQGLINSPNDDLTAANMRYWLALNLAVYGRAAFKVGLGSLSRPNAVYPLDARHLRVNTDIKGRITSYMYGNARTSQRFGTKMKPDRSGYAYQISAPGLSGDPVDNSDQLLPLNSLGGPVRVIEALLLRTLATAQGHPNSKYIVTTEDSLTEAQLDEVEEYIQDHETFGERSGEIMWLKGTKLEVHRLDSDLNNIHSKVPMDDMSRMIFGAYGIPIALAGLGAADSAKFAGNFAEGRQSFYSDTIIPEYLSPLADGLTQALCPPGLRIRFDYDSIPALLPARLEAAAQLKDVDFLTITEKRELIGFGPMEGV